MDNIVISPSFTIYNLGVLFDYNIFFITHITAITKSANIHIFRISNIRTLITTSLIKTLVNSFVPLHMRSRNSTVPHTASIFHYILPLL